MLQVLDILKVGQGNTIEPNMNLLHMKEQNIPGSIEYIIRRYYPLQKWSSEDTGMLVSSPRAVKISSSGVIPIYRDKL